MIALKSLLQKLNLKAFGIPQMTEVPNVTKLPGLAHRPILFVEVFNS